jgi:hypothetical protein
LLSAFGTADRFLIVYGIMKDKKSIINEVQIEVYPDNEVYKVSELEKR